MKLGDKILIILGLVALLAFPATGQYALTWINQGVDWLFQQMFIYSWVFMGALAIYLLLYCGFRYAQLTAVKIPKKTAKTHKAGKFIENV